jgi:thioester reductase-like protein
MRNNGLAAAADARIVGVRNKTVLNIKALHYEVIKFVFEKDKMKLVDIKFMMDSLVTWANHAKHTNDDDILYMVQMLSKILVDDESGKYDKRKRTYKEHGIDYRKAYEFPGSVTPADRARAKEQYLKWVKEEGDYK